MERRQYRITGRVQGVGFRAWTMQRARELGLSGLVRNDPDGSVGVEAEGTTDALRRLEAALSKGPPLASVREIEPLPAGSGPLPALFDVAF